MCVGKWWQIRVREERDKNDEDIDKGKRRRGGGWKAE